MQETKKALLIGDKLGESLFSTGFLQFRPALSNYDCKLLYYYLCSDLFLKQRDEFASGSTQIALTDKGASKIDLVVPPADQQKCIKDKLDVLLVKVKNAQSRLDKIPLILKRFRQAIVKNACLKNFLRKKNGKTTHWDKRKISDIAEIRLGKMLDKAKNKGEKTRYLRNINVRWFSFAFDSVFYMQVLPEEKEKLEIKNGDVFLCEGGEPGRCAVWELGKTDMVFQKALHRIRFSKKVNPHWFTLNVKNNADTGVLEEYFTGSTIKHFTGKSLAKYELPIPSIEDQNAIVKQVHYLFHQVQKIETRYISTKNYTDKLEQSILAKAFRGELVRQASKR